MGQKLRIWQEVAGKPSFRIQTEDENFHRQMLQSDRFELVGWGVNIPLWIHRAEFQSIQNARHTFERYFGKGDAAIISGKGS